MAVQSTKNKNDKVFSVNVISGGDPLEIYTDREGEVIFKKYSPIGELAAFASQYAETLYKTCRMAIVICDRDAVIASAGVTKRDYNDRKITPEFEKIMEDRAFVEPQGGESPIRIVETADGTVSCAMPIISDGDVTGAVASVNIEGAAKECTGEIEEKLIQTAAMFLGKQLES